MDGLIKQIQEKERKCEHCSSWRKYGMDACLGCGTYLNILYLELIMDSIME